MCTNKMTLSAFSALTAAAKLGSLRFGALLSVFRVGKGNQPSRPVAVETFRYPFLPRLTSVGEGKMMVGPIKCNDDDVLGRGATASDRSFRLIHNANSSKQTTEFVRPAGPSSAKSK